MSNAHLDPGTSGKTFRLFHIGAIAAATYSVKIRAARVASEKDDTKRVRWSERLTKAQSDLSETTAAAIKAGIRWADTEIADAVAALEDAARRAEIEAS